LADESFAAAFLDFAQQPLEVLLGLLVHGQRVHRIFHGDGADALQPTPNLDAQICRLGRKLVDEQEPAMRQHRGRFELHGIKTVSRGPATATYVSSTCCVGSPKTALNRRWRHAGLARELSAMGSGSRAALLLLASIIGWSGISFAYRPVK